jgi:hypothetical protein
MARADHGVMDDEGATGAVGERSDERGNGAQDDIPSAAIRDTRSGRRPSRTALVTIVTVVVAVTVGVLSQTLSQSGPDRASRSGGGGSHPAAVARHIPSTVPAGMHAVFDAAFRGGRLDAGVWATCYPWAATGSGCTNFGNRQEVEWYTPAQVSVRDGVARLAAVHQATTGKSRTGSPLGYPYRSGMVTTYPSFHFKYGYLRVVAKVPSGPDLWPALWLLPVSQNPRPEIDLLEGRPSEPSTLPLIALHPVKGTGWATVIKTGVLSAGWHTFGLNWEPGSLSWSVDGKVHFMTATGVPNVKMYFLADLAIARVTGMCLSASAPASCEGALELRSVEVWQR